MNIARIFANAVARRFAYLIVAAAFAFLASLFSGDAYAATCGMPSQTEARTAAGMELTYTYQGQAVAACKGLAAYHSVQSGGVVGKWQPSGSCTVSGFQVSNPATTTGERWNVSAGCTSMTPVAPSGNSSNIGWTWSLPGCPPGQTVNPDGTCGSCESKPPLMNVTGAPGSAEVCDAQCKFECSGITVDLTVDGNRRSYCGSNSWAPTGGQCSTTGPAGIGAPEAAASDADGDGTSDGNDSSPNNPGQGGAGESGEGADEDGDCGGEGQPECGAPGAGSGNGNTSGGGGNCDTPPSSTGDPILAQIAFQTWATRCAISGTANSGQTGDGEGDGWDGDPTPFPDAGEGEDPDPSDYNRTVSFDLPSVIDDGGLLSPQSCPSFGNFETSWGTVAFDSNGWFCQAVAVARVCLLLLGAFISIGILMGRGL